MVKSERFIRKINSLLSGSNLDPSFLGLISIISK